ncbi:MAG: signal peptidase I [Solirubrobacteraceae bacterium]
MSNRRKGPLRSVIELVVTVAIAVGLAFLIQAFLVKPYKIPSPSMAPTLKVGQRVLVWRLNTSPGVGQITVFHPPAGADSENPNQECGDRSEGFNAEDNADPTPCDKATVRESSQTFIKRVVGVGGDVLTIKHGHVYRNGVREHDAYIAPCGGVPECTFRRPIKVPRGMYYMMGDNRGDSDDSRFWGPVPQKWIVGVAFFTYWPPDRIGTL